MFIIDDILLRSIGVKLPIPFDTLSTMETIRDFALKEMYDSAKLNEELKKVRMLYDMHEISKEEYEKRKTKILQKLKIAERVREVDLVRRMDIKLV